MCVCVRCVCLCVYMYVCVCAHAQAHRGTPGVHGPEHAQEGERVFLGVALARLCVCVCLFVCRCVCVYVLGLFVDQTARSVRRV